jgi:hypothetical protein
MDKLARAVQLYVAWQILGGLVGLLVFFSLFGGGVGVPSGRVPPPPVPSPPPTASVGGPAAPSPVAGSAPGAAGPPTTKGAEPPRGLPPSPRPAPARLVVANTDHEGVYVRRTPRTDDRLVAWPDGTVLAPTGQRSDAEGQPWVQVRDPDGNVGWVPARYVMPHEE